MRSLLRVYSTLSIFLLIIQICQYDTLSKQSLGTYTNFNWTITEFDPLEFEIVYDGGTSAGTYERYVKLINLLVSGYKLFSVSLSSARMHSEGMVVGFVCLSVTASTCFYEMKGDVGMSVHEKERKQEDAYTKTQTHS